MTVTLIGSRAMQHWFTDSRRPGDWDWHSESEDDRVPGGDGFVDPRLGAWEWGPVATPDELYTMKISHIFWEINGPHEWNKHAGDIVFLSRKDAQFQRELYDVLLPIWKERYRRHQTNLNQTSRSFFKDAVKRKYEHDSVHETIAYGDRPLYESILREGSEVAVDNDKFWALDHDTKIKLVREEIMATALERVMIPNDYTGSPAAAYAWALRRTITSLFKGEWALFVALNLDELFKPDCDYVSRHINNKHKLREVRDV